MSILVFPQTNGSPYIIKSVATPFIWISLIYFFFFLYWLRSSWYNKYQSGMTVVPI